MHLANYHGSISLEASSLAARYAFAALNIRCAHALIPTRTLAVSHSAFPSQFYTSSFYHSTTLSSFACSPALALALDSGLERPSRTLESRDETSMNASKLKLLCKA